jgi:hypothetical protein
MSSKTFTPPKSKKNIGLALGYTNPFTAGYSAAAGMGLSVHEKMSDASAAAKSSKEAADAEQARLAAEKSARDKALKRAQTAGSRVGQGGRSMFFTGLGVGNGANVSPGAGRLFGD